MPSNTQILKWLDATKQLLTWFEEEIQSTHSTNGVQKTPQPSKRTSVAHTDHNLDLLREITKIRSDAPDQVGYTHIANELNNRGFTALRGGKIHPGTVAQLTRWAQKHGMPCR
jgi:hypothetical protein